MLTDKHIDSASILIKEGFKEINGLRSTLNSQWQHRGFPLAGDGSIQILYCGDLSKHCCFYGKVTVYDSLPMKNFSEELNKQLKDLYGKDDQSLKVTIAEVQKQMNSANCGCFAIAWAVFLTIGEKPEEVILDKKAT